MKRPIKPEEITEAKTDSIPGEVFEVFNALITENWNGFEAVVVQKEAVARISAAMNVSSQTIYNAGWVDVEESYRKAGWKVEYDKAGYNETYSSKIIFRK